MIFQMMENGAYRPEPGKATRTCMVVRMVCGRCFRMVHDNGGGIGCVSMQWQLRRTAGAAEWAVPFVHGHDVACRAKAGCVSEVLARVDVKDDCSDVRAGMSESAHSNACFLQFREATFLSLKNSKCDVFVSNYWQRAQLGPECAVCGGL